eukprot:gene27227-2481_t
MPYVPPHLRGVQASTPNPSAPADSASPAKVVSGQDARFAPPSQDGKSAQDRSHTKDEWERASAESQALNKYFSETDPEGFNEWNEVRTQGETDPVLQQFFGMRDSRAPAKSDSHRPHNPSVYSVNRLFNRYMKYAVNINHGIGYVEHCAALAVAREKEAALKDRLVWALDFGFAPGGMVELLLAAHPNVRVVGVTLDPVTSGDNDFPEDFKTGKDGRFFSILADVGAISRQGVHIPTLMQQTWPERFQVEDMGAISRKGVLIPTLMQQTWPERFQVEDMYGFDLAIIGITVSNNKDTEDYNGTKLELIFREGVMRTGGAVMMRMHMSLRLVDFHLHAFMLGCFGYVTPGQESAPPRTTKPMTEYAIRGTYWSLYEGFVPNHDSWARLNELVQPTWGAGGAYAFDQETSSFAHPSLVDGSVEDILRTHGPVLVKMIGPNWRGQSAALEGMMQGKKTSYCKQMQSCRGGPHCYGAHNKDELIPCCQEPFRRMLADSERFVRPEKPGSHHDNARQHDLPSHQEPSRPQQAGTGYARDGGDTRSQRGPGGGSFSRDGDDTRHRHSAVGGGRGGSFSRDGDDSRHQRGGGAVSRGDRGEEASWGGGSHRGGSARGDEGHHGQRAGTGNPSVGRSAGGGAGNYRDSSAREGGVAHYSPASHGPRDNHQPHGERDRDVGKERDYGRDKGGAKATQYGTAAVAGKMSDGASMFASAEAIKSFNEGTHDSVLQRGGQRGYNHGGDRGYGDRDEERRGSGAHEAVYEQHPGRQKQEAEGGGGSRW